MKVTLSNDVLTVVIDSHGAELQSIMNNRTRQEYLWQGDKAFWGRRSPVLFPIVGSVWNGVFRMNGQEYPMGQHGFARDSEFEVMQDVAENEAWFALESSEHTLAMFPGHFRLEIGYALQGERLSVMWRVRNIGDKDLCFQIGAHPAFNYPDYSSADSVHGYFNIDGRELKAQFIETKGCVGAVERVVKLDEDGIMPLNAHTFSDDALIFAEGQVRRVSMLDKNKAPYLTLLFSSPVVGLWSPPAGNAPFVCIEPWWGRCDRVGFTGDLSEREYVNSLDPGAEFAAGYVIIIDNI